MSLVSFGNELRKASQQHYAIPLFDAFDATASDGMFQAAEDCRAPVIIAVYTGHLDAPGGGALAKYVLAKAEEADVPVSIMLDHGGSFDTCIRALKLGLTDVMFDGSKLPLDENIVITRQVVQAAHAVGACVEAELGHVGQGNQYQSFGSRRLGFTAPESLERFVAETGVDFLAVAIGSAHGVYQGEPHLDLDLLEALNRRAGIPLVMHGGSGLSGEQFQSAIRGGIAKVNIATDLYMTATQRVVAASEQADFSYFDMSKVMREAFRERCHYYFDLFGTTARA